MSRFEWWYSRSFMTTGCRVNWRNVIKSAFLSLRHLTFRQITRRPVVIEEWKYHHSNRLIVTSRMVVFPFFYDHWMPSFMAKCHQISIITFDTAPFDVSSNNSTSSGRRRMGVPPFDSSRRAGSNGGIFVLLRSLDVNGI